jgi:hypothetical protein
MDTGIFIPRPAQLEAMVGELGHEREKVLLTDRRRRPSWHMNDSDAFSPCNDVREILSVSSSEDIYRPAQMREKTRQVINVHVLATTVHAA